jgi:dienelactone hydrolase
MKPLLIGLLTLATLAPASAQENSVQDRARELRGVDLRVFKPGSDEAKQAPDLVAKYFKARRDQVNRDSLQWKFDTKAAWEKLRDEKIANLKASLGRFPEPPARVDAHVTRTIAGEGFVIHNILYESRPGLVVAANLYQPQPVPKSAPGIVIIHSHHNPKTQGELQDMSMLWARAGCYVLVPDMLGHGERRQHPFHTEKDYPGPFKVGRQDYFFRYNSGLQLQLIGESLAGWLSWDVMRGVDLLLTRPGIDPQRIALFGSVAGGGDPAAVTAALDPRIKVVAPFNFGGPQPETKFPLPDNAEEAFNYVGGGSWESTRNLRGTGSGGYLPWLIVASVAPRAIIHAHEFAWDRDRDPAWKRYQQIMDLYGAKDKLAFTYGRGSVKGKPPESTHCNNIGVEQRKMMHPALNRWFDIQATEYSRRVPASDLQCWTPELRTKLKPKALHEIAQEWAVRRQNEERTRLNETLQAWRQTFAVRGTNAVRRVSGNGQVETSIVLSSKGSLPIMVTVITPPAASGAEMRAVLCLSQQGREAFLKSRAEAIAALGKNGVTVILADLPGTGETRIGDGRGRTSYATSVSSAAQLLGTSLLELRLGALAELLHHLQNSAKGRTMKLALWGDSFAPSNDPRANLQVPYEAEPFPRLGEPLGGLLALLAPLVSDAPIAGAYVHGGLVSYRSLLESPFLYVPHDVVEPGFLAKMDLDEVARRFAPRPLKLEGLINGLNLTVDAAALRTSYGRTTEAYGAYANRLQLQPQRSSDGEIAAWLNKVLKGG